MGDNLAGILKHYTLDAQVFFTGTLCRNQVFNDADGIGHLHLLKSGKLTVHSPAHKTLVIREPSLLLYPRAMLHNFHVDEEQGVDLVCARIEFGARAGNPLTQALPDVLLIPLAKLATLAPTLDLLFAEASAKNCGRQAAIDRLCEFLLIQLLRYLMAENLIDTGLLAGLADKRLAKAITAMHNAPQRAWSLEQLAKTAGMSRARFAVHFRKTVGTTPGDYLAQWRIGLAQALLKKGKPVGLVADAVGYGSTTALSRAFKSHIGQTPTEWHRSTS